MTIKRTRADELLILQKQEQEMKLLLPHLYGMPWYGWAYEFFTTTNREAFLCAANQISKSTTQIRKFIDWATDSEKWLERWPSLNLQPKKIPDQFWYLYPTKDVATIEFETKWEPFLPKGKMKTDPVYGWEAVYKAKYIHSLKFKNGVTIYFKTYAQNEADLQSGSVYMLGFDEELPVHLLPELQFRLNATDGYFSGVFTATLGQDHWRRAMEAKETEKEEHIGAFKKQISLYSCQKYMDGSDSPWTPAKIKRAIARCPTKADEQRRVHGKFAMSSGLVYESFDLDRNKVPRFKIPSDWHIYEGVDIGSGGENGHPAAIAFIAVRPDFKFGAVFKAWRGDQIITGSGDIYLKHVELRAGMKPVIQTYDWASREFGIVAQRNHDSFVPAEKSHDIGDGLLNVLFKHGMLVLLADDAEVEKAAVEFTSILQSTPKRARKDDLSDAIKYPAVLIPWDFSAIDEGIVEYEESSRPRPEVPKKSLEEIMLEERRALVLGSRDEAPDPIQIELDYYNELYGS